MRWVIFCSLGELIGIGMAGMIALIVNNLVGEPKTFSLKIIVLISNIFAGLCVGIVTGLSLIKFDLKTIAE